MRRVALVVMLATLALLPVHASANLTLPLHTQSLRVHAIEDAAHSTATLHLAPADPNTKIIPRRVGAGNPLLRREVLGFAPYWELQDNFEWNYNLLSTVAYFGLDVNDNGTFATNGGGWTGWTSADLTTIINNAHAAGDRVVVVIRDFSDASINKIVTTSAMQSLIDGTMAAISSKNLDGVNVDFEPSGSPLYPDVPQGLVNLMTAMSTQVHTRFPGSEVSMDTYGGAASWDGGSFQIDKLAPAVDAFYIMEYDAAFSNTPGYAGPNAPLNGWTYNASLAVSQYLTKAPASKIILGVPYYGYVWSTASGAPYAPVVGGGGQAITYTAAVGNLTCGAVAQTVSWDATAQSPWAEWWSPRTGDPCGDNLGYPREMYFDNATSLGIKYDLVNSNNLRGTGMFTLGYDAGRTELWNELATKFTGASPWNALGGTLSSAADASAWGPNRADVFARAADNSLQQAVWNGTALNGWVNLGGVLSSSPGTVSWGAGRIDIFARGSNNGLWHLAWNGSAWSGWQLLGGGLGSGPDVASWAPNRLDVFVLGQNKALWHIAWNGTRWSAWDSLGGVLTSDPTAVSWGPNRIDVFARGQDNGLWHLTWNGSRWSAWQSLGGTLTSGPDASSCRAGHLDVFAPGANGHMLQLGFTGTAWTGWTDLGQQWTDGPTAVCAHLDNAVDVFDRGSDNALWHIVVPAS